jgi:signal transduction histidine kinase
MVIDDDVEHARRALASIEETSKEALAEMRRLLGVLRAETSGAEAGRAPVPTLDDLDRLVAHAVEGGTPVDVQVAGDRRSAPAGIELAAYRVLQEALTNVRRHAPGSGARVRVGFEPDELVIEVENRLADGKATRRREATGSSACGSASRSTAARSTPGPAPTGRSG